MTINTFNNMPSVRCDTCGKKATRIARDLERIQFPEENGPIYRAVGKTRAGCDDHPIRVSNQVA